MTITVKLPYIFHNLPLEFWRSSLQGSISGTRQGRHRAFKLNVSNAELRFGPTCKKGPLQVYW